MSDKEIIIQFVLAQKIEEIKGKGAIIEQLLEKAEMEGTAEDVQKVKSVLTEFNAMVERAEKAEPTVEGMRALAEDFRNVAIKIGKIALDTNDENVVRQKLQKRKK